LSRDGTILYSASADKNLIQITKKENGQYKKTSEIQMEEGIWALDINESEKKICVGMVGEGAINLYNLNLQNN
jgi:WD40 repeat protein